MNALEQKLVSLLHQEFQALLEKIEALEGGDSDYAIADFINRAPLSKFERLMLVRAYRRYESRTSRFKAMELLFPATSPIKTAAGMGVDTGRLSASTATGTFLMNAAPKAEGARIKPTRSKVAI
jgi:hypothetical protein